MAQPYAMGDAHPHSAEPVIRKIKITDLWEALAKGIDDFKAHPTHVVFIGLIYPIMGLALGRAAFGYEMLPLLFPLVAGFALIGPFAAIGLYELSRRRERGLDTAWWHAFDVLHSPSIRSIALLGVVLMLIFVVWLAVAEALYGYVFGGAVPASLTDFIREVFTTRAGWTLIVLGNGIGLLFAIAVFAISVVSFPLLIDRNVSVTTAVQTSIRAVIANPVPMAVWAFTIAALLVIGSIPLLMGLAVVMPVLGHASWHLYRVVAPKPGE